MFTRYALYFTPDGQFADLGASWLGWDLRTRTSLPHPDIADVDLAAATQRPRKYGFHGTLKPPFALAEGVTANVLLSQAERLAAELAPIEMDGLEVAKMGQFLALRPVGDTADLAQLAARIVTELDPCRAAPSAQELQRRRTHRLSDAQESNLQRWGYPYVLDQFRFHMTLTGLLAAADRETLNRAAQEHFKPYLNQPFRVEAISLVGEGTGGMFSLIRRLPLNAQV